MSFRALFARTRLRPHVPVHVRDLFEGFELKARPTRRGWRARSRFRHRPLQVDLLRDPATRQPATLQVELWLSVECAFSIKCTAAASTDEICFPTSTGDRVFDSGYAICAHDRTGIPDREFIELWLKVPRVRRQLGDLIPLGSEAELQAGRHTLTLKLAWREIPHRQLNGLAAQLLELAATLQLYAAPSL